MQEELTDPFADLNLGEWICECGAQLDPLSSEWRCAGSYWEHYHGYPIGHVPVFRQPLPAANWVELPSSMWPRPIGSSGGEWIDLGGYLVFKPSSVSQEVWTDGTWIP
jgi:hypothetical protein